jgi:hypothetical protein
MFPEDVFMNTWYIVVYTNRSEEANHGPNRHHLSIPDSAPALGVSAGVTDAPRFADP